MVEEGQDHNSEGGKQGGCVQTRKDCGSSHTLEIFQRPALTGTRPKKTNMTWTSSALYMHLFEAYDE